jgi:tRNA (guanine-N7-)-methyltransferase
LGKNKLSRFRELEKLDRVFQPSFEEVYHNDFHLKGQWKQEVFGNSNPLILELGCGKGDYTVGLARKHPECNFMGLDIKGARIWKGAHSANDETLQNVAFLRTRIDFIQSFFVKDEVDEIWITFPDPQEKKRRQKKRLTGALFLNRYRHILKNNGVIHLKTDNNPLYNHTRDLIKYNGLEIEASTEDLYGEKWDHDALAIQTYYESRFLSEGALINYIRFRLPSAHTIKELPDDDG